jgi:hypothetical protein
MSAISLAWNESGLSSGGVVVVVVLVRVVVDRSGVFEVDAVGIVGPAFLSSGLTIRKIPMAARASRRTPPIAAIGIHALLFGFWPGGGEPGGGGHEEPPAGPVGGAGGPVNPYCWGGGGGGVVPNGAGVAAANGAGVAP